MRNLVLTAAALLNALFVFAFALLLGKVAAGLWIFAVLAVLFRVVLDHTFSPKHAVRAMHGGSKAVVLRPEWPCRIEDSQPGLPGQRRKH